MNSYKIVFCDLDGTIINTKSGEDKPKGIWDMEIRFDVLDGIKKLGPLAIFIVTNQPDIENGSILNKRNFDFKMEYLIRSITEYTNIFTQYSYCASNDENDEYRKPNIGMLNRFLYRFTDKFFKDIPVFYDVDCLVIGDGINKKGLYNIDKMTAENFGCDYFNVNDFIKFINNNDMVINNFINNK